MWWALVLAFVLGACMVCVGIFVTLVVADCVPGCHRASPAAEFVPRSTRRATSKLGRVHLVTFGAGGFEAKAQALGREMTSQVDEVHVFTAADLDPDFRARNAATLRQRRGFGLWLWKPYLCERVWSTLAENDVLVYLDGGQRLKGPLATWVTRAVESEGGGVVFCSDDAMGEQTKGDVFAALNMNVSIWEMQAQAVSGFFVVQKRASLDTMFQEWLRVCEQPYLLWNVPSQTPNAPLFRSRYFRPEQSVWSLLAYREGLDRVSDLPLKPTKPSGYQWRKARDEFRLNLAEWLDDGA